MKTRTLTSRNLLGGFCGGFLGIIAFSVFHLLLPLGCLLGVVIGFWYQEIGKAIKDESLKAYTSWCSFYNDAITAPRDKFREYIKRLKAKWSGKENTFADFWLLIARVIIGTLRLGWKLKSLSVKTTCWPFKHPMNGVYLATTAAVMCLICPVLVSAYGLSYLWMLNGQNGNDGSWMPIMFFAFGFPLSLPISMVIATAFEDDMKSFYKDWSRCSRYGLLYHLGYKFLQTSKVFVLMLLWECLGLAYVVFGLVTVLGFMALPISLAKAVLRVLWRFANMADHWLCFIATLAVTISSALLLHSHLHGAWLWVTAMSTGCASGLISELARQAVNALIATRPSVMTFANRRYNCSGENSDPFDDFIVPLWKNNWSWLHKYAIGWIPVPIDVS